MHDSVKAIALRIRTLREIGNVEPAALARELGVSAEQLAAYEAGNADIPVGFLNRLAARFNVDLATLLTGENPHVRQFCVVRKGTGPALERRAQYKYESLAPQFQHKKAEPLLVTVDPPPDGAAPQLNSHPGQEFNYVVAGRLQVIIGGREVVLHEGDSLYFDSGVPHAMRALGGHPAKFLAVIL